jgi:hypothetical protein
MAPFTPTKSGIRNDVQNPDIIHADKLKNGQIMPRFSRLSPGMGKPRNPLQCQPED